MGVNIDVDLDISGISDDIAAIEAAIESLDEKINVDLDFDLDDALDDTTVDVSGIEAQQDESGVSRSDAVTHSLLRGIIDQIQALRRGQAISGLASVGSMPSGRGNFGDLFGNDDAGPMFGRVMGFNTGGGGGGDDDSEPFDNIGQQVRQAASGAQELFDTTGDDKRVAGARLAEELSETFSGLRTAARKTGRALNKIRPTMGALYAILATLLPLILSAAVEIVGLGVALGGLAAAGGAIGVLSLLGGEADTMAGSVKNAERRVKDFKVALFEAFEPAADSLAPLMDRAFNRISNQASRLNDEAIALGNTFGGFFLGAIRPGTSLLETLSQELIRMAPVIKDVAAGLGQFIQNNLPGFLRALVNEGVNAIPKLKRLGALIGSIALVIYEASQIVSEFVASFAIFAPVLRGIATFLGIVGPLLGKLAAIATTAIAPILLLGTALTGLSAALTTSGALMKFWSGTAIGAAIKAALSFITTIKAAIAQLYAFNAAAGIAAGAVALLTGGVSLIGAGLMASDLFTGPNRQPSQMAGSGVGRANGGLGNSGSAGVTVNIYGDPETSTITDGRDQFKRAKREVDNQRGAYEQQ